MNKIAWAVFGFTFVICQSPGFAESLVKFPSGDAAWTVTITPKPSAVGVPITVSAAGSPLHRPEVKEVDITQVNNVKRVRLTWTDGKVTECWTLPNLPVVFEEVPSDGSIRPVGQNDTVQKLNQAALAYDSGAFDWLKTQYRQEDGTVSYLSKNCAFYKAKTVPPWATIEPPSARPPSSANPSSLPKSPALPAVPQFELKEAWIDNDTLLPVALDTGKVICVYTFDPKPPTVPLVLPPKFKKEVDYYRSVLGLH